MNLTSLRQFGVFTDKYYWQTAVLIAKNGLARQYRNSFLGILWMLLQPLTMLVVYAVIMPMIARFSVPNYALYLIISLPLWNFFSLSFNISSSSILNYSEVLKRCIISSTVFPVADVLRNTYTFFISFLTMYTVALLFGLAKLSPMLLLLPVFFIPVLMIVGSVAIALAFLAPYIRDIGEFIVVSMNVLFWLTPVVYPYADLPGNAQMLMKWNPFFIMLHPIQMLGYDNALPGMGDIIRLLGLTLLAIAAGFSIFGMCRRNYVYYL